MLGVVALARADGTGTPQVVGGGDVPDPNPYTYQVSIGDTNGHFCGGSIIAADWVLSAAHCFFDDQGMQTQASTLVVRVGIRALSAATASDERSVSNLYIHESYNPKDSASLNDIALLKLATPVDASWIVPLSSAANDATLTAPGKQSIATGWGSTIGYDPGTQNPPTNFPDILQVVQMPIVDNATCQIADSQLCAGVPQGGLDTCQGDSGGPLVVGDGAGGYIQVGVVSNGAGCASVGNYGTYTRVASFRDWLSSKMSPPVYTNWVYLPIESR